jgi:hypothetical protein
MTKKKEKKGLRLMDPVRYNSVNLYIEENKILGLENITQEDHVFC